MENQNTYPKSFSHIGLTVPDIHKAVEFYEAVMGWYTIMKPSKVKREKDTAMGADNPSQNEDLKDYLKAKQNADNYLKESGIDYTIVRPGTLNNEGNTGKIQLKNKFEEHGSISRADVAQTLVEVLETGIRKNQVFEILTGETPIDKALKS